MHSRCVYLASRTYSEFLVFDMIQEGEVTTKVFMWLSRLELESKFDHPAGVAVDQGGNVIVTDWNHRIWKVASDGTVSDIAGSGDLGFADGQVASFGFPGGVAVDPDGNVIVADSDNHRIRKVTPDGLVSTMAGSGVADFADGQGNAASFNEPIGVAIDHDGNVIVADKFNHRIRKVTPDGTVTTIAGSGSAGCIRLPADVAIDGVGNIIVADAGHHRIRMVTPDGSVSTIAGSGNVGFADGQGVFASFKLPVAVAIDTDGNVIVADAENHRIRKVTPDGLVSTMAGSGVACFANGLGDTASFSYPWGVAIDYDGNIIVADHSNHRICSIASGHRLAQKRMFHMWMSLRELMILRRAGLRCTALVFEDDEVLQLTHLQVFLRFMCKLPRDVMQRIVMYLNCKFR